MTGRYTETFAYRHRFATMILTFAFLVSTPAWLGACFVDEAELEEIESADQPPPPMLDTHISTRAKFLGQLVPAVLAGLQTNDLEGQLIGGDTEFSRRVLWAIQTLDQNNDPRVMSLLENGPTLLDVTTDFLRIAAGQTNGDFSTCMVALVTGQGAQGCPLAEYYPAFQAIADTAAQAPSQRVVASDLFFAQADLGMAPNEITLATILLIALIVVAIIVILYLLFPEIFPPEAHDIAAEIERAAAELKSVAAEIKTIPGKILQACKDYTRDSAGPLFGDSDEFCECTLNRPFTTRTCPEFEMPDFGPACDVFGC